MYKPMYGNSSLIFNNEDADGNWLSVTGGTVTSSGSLYANGTLDVVAAINSKQDIITGATNISLNTLNANTVESTDVNTQSFTNDATGSAFLYNTTLTAPTTFVSTDVTSTIATYSNSSGFPQFIFGDDGTLNCFNTDSKIIVANIEAGNILSMVAPNKIEITDGEEHKFTIQIADGSTLSDNGLYLKPGYKGNTVSNLYCTLQTSSSSHSLYIPYKFEVGGTANFSSIISSLYDNIKIRDSATNLPSVKFSGTDEIDYGMIQYNIASNRIEFFVNGDFTNGNHVLKMTTALADFNTAQVRTSNGFYALSGNSTFQDVFLSNGGGSLTVNNGDITCTHAAPTGLINGRVITATYELNSDGDLTALGHATLGSMTTEGDVSCNNLTVDGTFTFSGAITTTETITAGNLVGTSSVTSNGSMTCHGLLTVNGSTSFVDVNASTSIATPGTITTADDIILKQSNTTDGSYKRFTLNNDIADMLFYKWQTAGVGGTSATSFNAMWLDKTGNLNLPGSVVADKGGFGSQFVPDCALSIVPGTGSFINSSQKGLHMGKDGTNNVVLSMNESGVAGKSGILGFVDTDTNTMRGSILYALQVDRMTFRVASSNQLIITDGEIDCQDSNIVTTADITCGSVTGVIRGDINGTRGQVVSFIGENSNYTAWTPFDYVFRYGNGAVSNSIYGIGMCGHSRLKRFVYQCAMGSGLTTATRTVFSISINGALKGDVFIYIDWSDTTYTSLTNKKASGRFSSSGTAYVPITGYEIIDPGYGYNVSYLVNGNTTGMGTENDHRMSTFFETTENW